jgi:cytoskeletal protein RodZ
MTQKPQKSAAVPGKKSTLQVIKGALVDLFVLALLLAAAGFGGYFWGTHQKLAVVDLVPPGTPGAREAVNQIGATKAPESASASQATPATSSSTSKSTDSTAASSSSSSSTPTSVAKTPAKHTGKLKYWVSSSGTRLIGYAIAVTVNGQPVDNFFAPGKQVDITDIVKKGKNSVDFDAKVLEDKFNQHKGDDSAVMTVSIDSGPAISENVKPADVLVSYKRNAAETENYTDQKSFTVE